MTKLLASIALTASQKEIPVKIVLKQFAYQFIDNSIFLK